MTSSKNVARARLSEVPEVLRPFVFHGLDLQRNGVEFSSDCPFCGREGKMNVNPETTLWRCVVCEAHGNAQSFVARLWESCAASTDRSALEPLREHRRLLSVETLAAWGVVVSSVDGGWLVPGRRASGDVCQLYRYVRTGARWVLLATPGLSHGLFGPRVGQKANGRRTVFVHEGPWDGMAAWEVLASSSLDEATGQLAPCRDRKSSVLASVDVVAVPSCTTWRPDWSGTTAGRHVALMFDNDHPRTNPKTEKVEPPAAFSGARRMTENLLADTATRPASVSYLAWGGDADHDPDLPAGHDVRDSVCGPDGAGHDPVSRAVRYSAVLAKVRPVPSGWLPSGYLPESRGGEGEDGGDGQAAGSGRSGGLEEEPCSSWSDLTDAWRAAVRWTEGLDRALSVMLAAAASTRTMGDQLWVKVLGPPGCGKSTLCEALAVNRRYVKAVSTLRGFHSGFKTDRAGEQDHSLIARVKDKTLVLKDGDTLLQSPNLGQVLSEARDIYDRTSRAHYRHGLERDYDGINMTWIVCGTQTLRKLDHSELGARFLDCVMMEGVDEDLEDDVLDRVVRRAVESTKNKVNGRADSQESADMIRARRMTAGYLSHLRDNDVALSDLVEFPQSVMARVVALGKFVSYMRCRPSERKETESVDREIGTRLTGQLARLAVFLAVVLNRDTVDGEVMRRVRRVAMDTSRGHTLELVKFLDEAGERGLDTKALTNLAGHADDRTKRLLTFLRGVGAVELFRAQAGPGVTASRWRLTPRFASVYAECHPR